MKVSKDFILHEFIDPDTFKIFGDSSIWFIDPRIIQIAQFIRDKFQKAITINDWHQGGKYHLSGFRPGDTMIGATFSQHRYGRAIDIKIESLPNNGANVLRNDIIENFQLYNNLGLTTIESGVFSQSWCHIDCRYIYNQKELFIVKP